MPLRYPLLLLWWVLPASAFSQLSKDSLLQVIQANQNNAEATKAYVFLASEYLRSNTDKAKEYTYTGLSLARTLHSPDLESSFYSLLITLHTNAANPDSALFYLQLMKKGAAIYPLATHAKLHYNYNSSAGLFYKKRGNYKVAFPFLVKAAAIAAQMGNKEMAAGQYLNIGNTYVQVGDHSKALRYHLQALKLFESIGNQRGTAFCYQSIGIDFMELKQYSKALSYAKLALQQKQALNDRRGIGSAYTTLGEIYRGLRQPAPAMQYFSQAIAIAKELGLKAEEAKATIGLGHVYSAKNDVETAQQLFDAARQLSLAAADSTLMGKAEKALFALKENWLQAAQKEQLLVRNLQSQIHRGDYNDETESYKQLAKHYEEGGNFEKALYFNKLYHQKKDSLSNAQVQLEVAQLEGQYKGEIKEKQIQLLKKDQQLSNARLQRQLAIQWATLGFFVLLLMAGVVFFNRYKALARARRLLEMEKIRNNIARDLHDDIGSTLSSIHILSKVLLQQTGENSHHYAGLKKIGDHSAAMMESMGDIVWAVNPQNDRVEQVIIKMKEFAAEMLDPLNIQYQFVERGDLRAVKLDPARRKDLFLIFKEAVNNAAKYSQCRNITVVLEHDGQSLHLHVADNGKGFDEAAVKKGNGLHNMKARAGSMQARLHCQSTKGVGTTVQLAIASHD